MEEFKEAAKKLAKMAIRTVTTLFLPIIVIILIIVILISAFIYFITIDDGTYKEDDWSNAPYAASTYVNGTTINSDGSISTSITPQELWDKMIENGSNVDDYLDSPEDLAKLMKAEMITQYPDTRPNPDEAVDWESVINGDSIQGIIKFKRAYTDGNKSTMTYVDPATFQGYIDEYNSTGSESAKQAALSHFTLRQTAASTSSGNGGAIAAGEGVMTDVSQRIIEAANNTPWPGAQLCAGWVDNVYENAGVGACRHYSAYESYKHHCISNDMSAIPIGAAVYGTGSGRTGPYGHIGIYIGDGKVIDSQDGGIIVSTMEDWLSWQVDVLDGKQGWLGWGWEDNNRTRGTTEDPNVSQSDGSDSEEQEKENEENADENGNVGSATEIPNSGDGYDSEYVSSAGITYKQFKQYKGTYANNPYWTGTIYDSGCGPTSVSILASGLTNNNYTPADIAAEMNSKYGLTSYDTLKQEMDSLGMAAEVDHSPTVQKIQDNLRNGKVLLVSVQGGTIFTNNSHIMAVVDINEQGQVYISNPSSDTLNGWFDPSEIMKDCNYIITTDAGAAGIAKSNNNSNYVAVVATWRQVDTTVTTNDPNVEPVDTTTYTMTTTDVNYEVMVEPYTMPFDLLWAFLVCGDGQGFVMELADLVYNSDIEITVHDNLTINTDVDDWTYTLRTKAEVGDATITANCGGITESGTVAAHTHDPWGEDQNYRTVKTVVTQTNTLNIAVTRANVWIVDYQNEFTYKAPSSNTTNNTVTHPDTEYTSSGTANGSSFTCTEIDSKKSSLGSSVRQRYISSHSSSTTNTSNLASTTTSTVTPPTVTYDVDVLVEYFTKYINIEDNITNTVETQKYIQGTPILKEKTDPDSEEPNFVTIFNDPDYEKNSSSIRSVAEWLFEILETNDSTSDMVDLIKYLLYKATGADYGVTEFDFSIFYPGSLNSVSANDYIVHIDMSPKEIVIDDLETLKTAFAGSGGAGSENLVAYAEDFLRLQEEYRVNAVFAAAVTTAECGAGTNLQIGGNNWFSIRNPSGGWMKYDSPAGSIEAFCNQIARLGYYFTEGNYTVRSIGMIYCEDADAPGGWIENVLMYMTNMFNAAGIDVSQFIGNGGDFLEVAKECHDYVREHNFVYYNGNTIPIDENNYNGIDCSAYVTWVLYEYGYTDLAGWQQTTRTLLGLAQRKGWTVKDGSQAQAGDIVLIPAYHTAIYAGNGQFYDCGSTDLIRSVTTTWNPGYDYAITVTKP